MTYARTAYYEASKQTFDALWQNVWSLPLDQSRPMQLDLYAAARSAADVRIWGVTCLFNTANNAFVAVLPGTFRDVFPTIRTNGTNTWDIRAEIIDAHLNIDLMGAANTPMDWVVRLEFMQWPEPGQFSAVAGKVI